MAESLEILHITGNAYRVLGIFGNAPQELIHRAEDIAHASLTIGVSNAKAWDLPWIGEVSRSQAEVKEALGCLANPAHRLHERLFWFHDGEAFLKGLVLENVDETAAKWAEATSPAARHDSALLKCIAAFVLDPRLEDAERWRETISSWRQAVESDAYWKLIADVERKGAFASRVKDEDIKSLRDSSFKLVVDSIYGHALQIANSQDREAVHRVLRIFRMVELPAEMLADFEGQVLGPLEREFHTLCSEIRRKCDDDIRKDDRLTEENRAVCRAALARFASEVEPELAIILDLTDKNSHVGRKSLERAAFCLQGLALNHIWAREFDTATKLLTRAKGMVPPDSVLIRRLEESASTVAEAAMGRIITPQDDPFLRTEPKETRSGIRFLMGFAAVLALFTVIGAYLYSSGYLTDKRATLSPPPKKETSIPEPAAHQPAVPSSRETTAAPAQESRKTDAPPAHPREADTELHRGKDTPPPSPSPAHAQEVVKGRETPAASVQPTTSGIYGPSQERSMKAKKAKEAKSKAVSPKTTTPAIPRTTLRKQAVQKTDGAAAAQKEKLRRTTPVTTSPPPPAPKDSSGTPAATTAAGKELLKSLESQIAKNEAAMARLEQKLSTLMRELDSLERSASNYRTSIQLYERQVESGASIDQEKYKRTVEEYNRLSHTYNGRLAEAKKTAAEHEGVKKQHQKLVEQYRYLSSQ